jgi:N-acetylmuramoyl-L-alanine amidase
MPIKHTVKPGDSLTSIAEKYGFFPDLIWNDAANLNLKMSRKNMDILQADDLVVIPDKRSESIAIASDAKHTFRRLGVPASFRVRINGPDSKPAANTPYRLDIDGKITKGQLNGQGELNETIPPSASKAKLYLGEPGKEIECAIHLGHLDPIDSIKGIQARLNNLGYCCGPIDGQLNDATKSAILMFQQAIGHSDPSGNIDEQTRNEIEKSHEK